VTDEAIPPDPDRLTKWIGWTDGLRQHLLWVHHHRELWTEMRDAIQQIKSETGGIWLRHYAVLYAETQVMAVRRVVRGDAGKGQVALTTLLNDMEVHPEVVTADWIERRALARDLDVDKRFFARRERERFIERWGEGGDALSIRKIRADRAELMKESRKVVAWADTNVAHIGSPEDPVEVPTFGELDAAIDHVSDLFQAYGALLTDATSILRPVIQPNWKELFTRPLFEIPV
jgi:hypothetical protein